MSMEPKVAAIANVVIDGEGSITSQRNYNCQIAGAGVGLYDITIGEGGADNTFLLPSVVNTGNAAVAGANVTSTSDTVKRVSFFAAGGAAVDPAGFTLQFLRYPPLPTP